MTQTRKSYYLNAEGPDKEEVKKGIIWLLQKSKECDGGFLAVPVIGNLSGTIESIFGTETTKKLAKEGSAIINGVEIELITDRKTKYNADNKPVFALYGGKKFLDKIDSISNISEMLVYPWIMDEIKNWIQTWNAVELGKPQTAQTELISNPVVVRALESLAPSVNRSTGISHPSDRSRTIWTFKILKENDEQFDPDQVKSWLISKGGWRPDAAEQAAEFARGILHGKIYQAGQRMYVGHIIDMWREEAGVERRRLPPKPIPPMEMIPVSSSHIRAIGYDASSKILQVLFHDGHVYQYLDVPETVYSQLMNAESHGEFFGRYMRTRYRYKQIR